MVEKSHVSSDIQLSIWIGTQGDGDQSSRPPHHSESAATYDASGEGQGKVRVDATRGAKARGPRYKDSLGYYYHRAAKKLSASAGSIDVGTYGFN
ncbi:hypothetical protein NL676_024727 [Syzygium grande]|nr:hypothetical protein NL676_024727 [Syzygium grande]